MATTSYRNIPYPVGSDAPDGPGGLYDQALALESEWEDGASGIGFATGISNADSGNPSKLHRNGKLVSLVVNLNVGSAGANNSTASLMLAVSADFRPASDVNFVGWGWASDHSGITPIFLDMDHNGSMFVRGGSLPANGLLYGAATWVTA